MLARRGSEHDRDERQDARGQNREKARDEVEGGGGKGQGVLPRAVAISAAMVLSCVAPTVRAVSSSPL